MNKRLAIYALVPLGLLGISWQVFSRSEQRPEQHRQVQCKRGPLDVSLVATGVVQPQNRVAVKPPVSGRVEEVLLKEGAKVKRGELMAWLSSSERAALLDAARAKGPKEVKEWEELFRPTPILAPIDGAIIQRNVESGQGASYSDTVFVIADRLIVRTLVDETDIAQIRVGQPADIVLDAYADRKLAGHVDKIAFDAKTINSVTTYEVDVVPRNPPEFLRSGMTSNVTFAIASKGDALLVPAEAVKLQGGKSTVLVPQAAPGLGPTEREIQVGLSDYRSVEVVGGLADGDTVLVPELQWEESEKKGRGLFKAPSGRTAAE